ncbi:ABC transporter permease [Canibacter sp. lx-45]|uniref:ABC transporter permease n=1 Tax=Canibacter zhuwentaonis TaxID=2837491 RepID=UPI001BDD19AE|nr:ABC transporter permease [Canibacter zhuwentaonis]MBT1035884.1 ABC transporter permease [Canibacter zhuwentaonis]
MSQHPKAGSQIRILKVWYKQELFLLFREPVAVFFSLAFPLIIYIFVGVPYADSIIPETQVRFIDLIFPSLLGIVAANLLLMGLSIYIAELRARQVDKRYRSLPLSGVSFATAIISAMLTLTVLASGIIISVVGATHRLRPEVIAPMFILLNIGLIAFLCCIGFFLGTLPLGTRAIQALTTALFFVMFFGSGAAVPIDALPKIVQQILEWNPLKIWFDALVAAYTGTDFPDSSGWKIALTFALALCCALVGLRNWKKEG